MRIRKLRTVTGILPWVLAFSFAGCRSTQPPAPAEVKMAPERAAGADEARGVAEATLGKQAEIVAKGDLALNGLEQVLVVNRVSKTVGGRPTYPARIIVTRAAIIEKNNEKWSEILRCDEHLKNPDGYLGGSPAARVDGWLLEFSQEVNKGLEMKFTPAITPAGLDGAVTVDPTKPSVMVRWNPAVKRYQSFDQSHERYLSEVPSLETPQSILK